MNDFGLPVRRHQWELSLKDDEKFLKPRPFFRDLNGRRISPCCECEAETVGGDKVKLVRINAFNVLPQELGRGFSFGCVHDDDAIGRHADHVVRGLGGEHRLEWVNVGLVAPNVISTSPKLATPIHNWISVAKSCQSRLPSMAILSQRTWQAFPKASRPARPRAAQVPRRERVHGARRKTSVGTSPRSTTPARCLHRRASRRRCGRRRSSHP